MTALGALDQSMLPRINEKGLGSQSQPFNLTDLLQNLPQTDYHKTAEP